jgi:hypothetical protein
MTTPTSVVTLTAAIGIIATAAAGVHAQTIHKPAPGQLKKDTAPPAPVAGVSLKIADEKVPPGGIVQVKVLVTEPRPISTAGGSFTFDGLDTIEGVALMSPAGDAMGVAIWRGGQLTLSIVSPSTTFGTDPDYPILTVAGRVAATTPVGTSFPLAIDLASLQFADPSGTLYPVHAGGGELLVAPNVGVDDVMPGSADLPAGATVSILGRGFEPTTKIRFKEVLLSRVDFIDPFHMLATTGEPIRMHGRGIRVTNGSGAETTYFSYQRVRRQFTSANPTLRDAVPVFDSQQVTEATFGVRGASTGLALQNRGDVPVTAVVDLLDATGAVQCTAQVRIGASRYVLADLAEVFVGVPCAAPQAVRVRALSPIQVMGVAVEATGAAPIVPR